MKPLVIDSPEQKEEETVVDNPLIPQNDVGIGTLASSGFDYPQIDVANPQTTRLAERLQRVAPIPVENLEATLTSPETDNTLVNPYGSFGFSPGLDLTPKETHVWSAAWHNSFPGATVDAIGENLKSFTPDPNYNVFDDIPDEFMNERDLKFFINSLNSENTENIAMNLRRQRGWNDSIAESPFQYAGAALLLGIVDPLTYALPGSAIREGAKALAAVGKTAYLAKDLARVAGTTFVAGATQQGITDLTKSATQEVSLEDAAYGSVTAGLVSSLLGTSIAAGISAKQINNFRKTMTQSMANGGDGPAVPSTNVNFRMPAPELVGSNYVAPEFSEKALENIPAPLRKSMEMSAFGRLINSKSPNANYAANEIFIHNYITSANVKANQATATPILAQLAMYNSAFEKGMLKVDAQYRAQFGIEGGLFQGMRARLASGMSDGKTLNTEQFGRAVADALEGIEHPNPHVMKSAKIIRDEIFMPALQELVDVGIMKEYFLTRPETQNYFPHGWIQKLMAETPDDFKAMLKGWFQESSNYYKSNREQIDALNKPVLELDAQIKALKAKAAKSKKGSAEIKSKIEELNAQLKNAEKSLYDFIPYKYLTLDGHIPSDKLDIELDAAVQQTYDRMLSNDLESFSSPFGIGGSSLPDVTMRRALKMPLDFKVTRANPDGTFRNVYAKDYLNRDPWKAVRNYAAVTGADVVLFRQAKARGLDTPLDLKKWYAEGINTDYNELKKGVTGAAARKLDDLQKRDKQDISDAFDMIYNVSGANPSPFGKKFAAGVRRLNDYNVARFLGSAGLSAVSDLAVPIIRQGFFTSMSDWLPLYLTKVASIFTKETHAFQMNKSFIQDLGYGIQTQIAMRQKAFLSDGDALVNHAFWREPIQFVKDTFGNLTVVNQISDFTEQTGGHLSISRTLRILYNKFEKGIYSEADRIRMRQVGISPEIEEVLYKMAKEGGAGRSGGSFYSNYDQWNINTADRVRAVHEFKSSVINDIDASRLRPGKQDLPTIAHDPRWKLVIQFKDWMFAANSRLLIGGAQKLGYGQYELLAGFMFSMGMGALSYVLNALAKNPTEVPNLSMDKLFKEGFDRCGFAGIWSDPWNVSKKLGLIPGDIPTRYQSRGAISSVIGPSIGTPVELLWDLAQIRKAIAGDIDYTSRQTKEIETLVPAQNVFYWRYMFDQVFQNTAVALGATDKRKK